MKTFQQNGVTYLAVEVPEGLTEFKAAASGSDRWIICRSGSMLWEHLIDLPSGNNYSIIGLLPEITAEQAKGMVDEIPGYEKMVAEQYKFALKSRLLSLGFQTENILIIKQLT